MLSLRIATFGNIAKLGISVYIIYLIYTANEIKGVLMHNI